MKNTTFVQRKSLLLNVSWGTHNWGVQLSTDGEKDATIYTTQTYILQDRNANLLDRERMLTLSALIKCLNGAFVVQHYIRNPLHSRCDHRCWSPQTSAVSNNRETWSSFHLTIWNPKSSDVSDLAFNNNQFAFSNSGKGINAELLKIWGFQHFLVKTIASHIVPTVGEGRAILSTVCVANTLVTNRKSHVCLW